MRLTDDVVENARLTRWADLLPRAPIQRGGVHETDAELVPLGDGRLLALTVDTVCEEIRLGLYRDPRTAGRLAAAAALSDLAAVGAEPLGLLLSVTLPPGNADAVQEAVARGVSEAASAAGTFVLGGDTNEGELLSVGCTGAGTVPCGAELRRLGISPGDLLFAAGPLGLGAAVAASSLFAGGSLLPESALAPPSRIAHGVALRGVASAAMDTSDGLVATLDQLARLNGVSLHVTRPPEELLDPLALATARSLGLPPLALLAATQGEQELVFAVPLRNLPALEEAATQLDWTPVPLGRAATGSGLFVNSAPFDGARARNLLASSAGDLSAYAAALVAMTR
ncbi:MAG: AIR synthase related protein [Thermoanaerobaculia bacterium]